jgi:hypothetical protein
MSVSDMSLANGLYARLAERAARAIHRRQIQMFKRELGLMRMFEQSAAVRIVRTSTSLLVSIIWRQIREEIAPDRRDVAMA